MNIVDKLKFGSLAAEALLECEAPNYIQHVVGVTVDGETERDMIITLQWADGKPPGEILDEIKKLLLPQ